MHRVATMQRRGGGNPFTSNSSEEAHKCLALTQVFESASRYLTSGPTPSTARGGTLPQAIPCPSTRFQVCGKTVTQPRSMLVASASLTPWWPYTPGLTEENSAIPKRGPGLTRHSQPAARQAPPRCHPCGECRIQHPGKTLLRVRGQDPMQGETWSAHTRPLPWTPNPWLGCTHVTVCPRSRSWYDGVAGEHHTAPTRGAYKYMYI